MAIQPSAWDCNAAPNNNDGSGNNYTANVNTSVSLAGAAPISPTIDTLNISGGSQLDMAGQNLTLAAATSSTVGTGSVLTNSGGASTLTLSGGGSLTNSGAISNLNLVVGSGATFTNNGGTLTAATITAQSGGTIVAGGITASSSYSSGNSALTLSAGASGTWNVNDGSTLALSGTNTIYGSLGNLTLNNSGTTTLNGANLIGTTLSGTGRWRVVPAQKPDWPEGCHGGEK